MTSVNHPVSRKRFVNAGWGPVKIRGLFGQRAALVVPREIEGWPGSEVSSPKPRCFRHGMVSAA